MRRRRSPTAAVLLLAVVSGLALAAQTPEERGLAIAVEADARSAGFGESDAELLMGLVNRRGDESTRRLRSMSLEVEGDGDKSLVVFDTPRDVKGTAMLTFTHKTAPDDQWLYLPALKRVKRISSANRSGSFMGSEFAYEDLSSEEVEKYTYRWIREDGCPGDDYRAVTCFVLERYPVDEKSGYTRQVVWIDQQAYRTLQIEYYDRKQSLLKTLTVTRFERYLDRVWRPNEMLMVNHQTGKRTRLVWQTQQLRTGLDAGDFTTASSSGSLPHARGNSGVVSARCFGASPSRSIWWTSSIRSIWWRTSTARTGSASRW